MKKHELHILIIAEATPRARIIMHLLEEKFPEATLKIVRVNDLQDNYSKENSLICILDLLSSPEPSYKVIEKIKKRLPASKIIGMHIYRSAALINPLYDYGIHGYLFCEPTRQELTHAINVVLKGEIYNPDFLISP